MMYIVSIEDFNVMFLKADSPAKAKGEFIRQNLTRWITEGGTRKSFFTRIRCQCYNTPKLKPHQDA